MYTNYSVSRDEYLNRLSRCREAGAERGFDAIVVTGAEPNRLSHLRYLANYRPWLGVTPTLYEHRGRGFGAIVIPVDPDIEPILISSSTYYEKKNVIVDKVIKGTNVPKMIVEALDQIGVGNGNIGLVGEDILYVKLYTDLKRYAPGANYVFCDDILLNMRKIKSPSEIELLKEGAHIGHLAALEGLKAFKVGVTEKEMVAVIEEALIKNGATDPWSMCQSGSTRSLDPLEYPYATDRVLRNGDIAFMEIMGDYKGYFIDLTRAGIIGGAQSPEQKIMLDTIYEMGLNVQRNAKPGVTSASMQWAAVQPAVDAGLGQYSILELGGIDAYAGHGLGLNIDEPPILTVSDKTLMKPNMVVAVEPGLYQTPWGGARIERTLMITGDGSEFLDEFENGWW